MDDIPGISLDDDDGAFEVRADQLTIEAIEKHTSIAGPAATIVKELLLPGAKLIIGPRGCGKTHLMRYAWTRSMQYPANPFAIYVSFNRYYRLEPLLRTKSNALDIFHGWAICLCYLGLYEAIEECQKRQVGITDDDIWLEYAKDDLEVIVSRIERGGTLPSEQQKEFDTLSISGLKQAIERIALAYNKKRSVILLDDAALTLAPEYLPDFFDFFRTLKTSNISPKASVYPGTTEYGPRFHVAHEADEVSAWFSIEDSAYLELMESIGLKRMTSYQDIPVDVRDLFKYAAFGVPRAYLILLNEYSKMLEGTPQVKVNSILENFVKNKEAEYLSLAKKAPKFGTLIGTGLELFKKICAELVHENRNLRPVGEKQLYIGIQESPERNAYVERMFSLLVEAGLLYGYRAVAHGKTRVYERFIPHLATLIRDRAFSASQGFSARGIVDILQGPSTKHPLRRSLSTLLGTDALLSLKFDLPPCQNCGTARLSESSRHCHQCGAQLTDASSFKSCMEIDLTTIPSLNSWQKERLKKERPDIRTVGDFLALRDPGSELRKMTYVGPRRANKINTGIESFVDEFLS